MIALFQASDIFVNPTLADNFPTVNIEALGAGLPVVTFKTGGSAECIDETSGIGVKKGMTKLY
ncbi:MAG: glycosyltransferase [Paludibacteraceae bacterium]|nr:glycosyltransferase [Paludibacteraceae bacterium]